MNINMVQKSAESNPLWEMAAPILAQMGFGGVLGWCAGYFSMKVLKIVAFLVGFLFVTVQVLIYLGYIEGVDWLKMGQGFSTHVDKSFFTTLWEVIKHNLPFGGGFAAGFVLGVKMG